MIIQYEGYNNIKAKLLIGALQVDYKVGCDIKIS
jgi:hypothetical protein